MKRALLAGLLVIAAAACGDNGKADVDGGGSGSGVDAPMIDAPPGTATLTSFVKDIITNQTTDSATPKAFTDFSTLEDPDGDNNVTTAYSSLF